MASLNPQTLINTNKSYFVKNPIDLSGLDFAGSPPVTITNQNGILTTNTGDILNDSLWSQFYASTGHIDMAPGGTQRITATDSQLFYNGVALAAGGTIADWSYFNADSGYVDFSGPTQRLTADDFNLIYNGVRILPGQGQDWYLFPAETDVDMSGNDLNNCNEVRTDKISDRTGNLLINPIQNLQAAAQNITMTASNNIITPSILTLQTSAGEYGVVNVTANSGTNGNGVINMVANGGRDPTGDVGYGGNITITANSSIGDLITQTSAIKLNAASILSYAGAIPPLVGVAGYNFIYGNVGVSIVSDVAGSLLPNFPDTVYLFGRLGVGIQSGTFQGTNYGLFVNDIQPFSDGIRPRGDLVIQGKGTAKVILKNVMELAGDTMVVTGVSSINSQTYVPTQAWASQPASTNVDMCGNSITRCLNINTDTINGLVPRPLAESIPSPYTITPSTLGTTVIYTGGNPGMTMNTSPGVVVQGFYFTFINGNGLGFDMNLTIDGIGYGFVKLGINIIIYNGGTWKAYQ
jgi:hypothetical protein